MQRRAPVGAAGGWAALSALRLGLVPGSAHATTELPCYFSCMPKPSDDEVLRRYGFEPDPVIEAYKKDVDRTLLRQNLRRTPEERWRIILEATRLADEMRRAGARARAR